MLSQKSSLWMGTSWAFLLIIGTSWTSASSGSFQDHQCTGQTCCHFQPKPQVQHDWNDKERKVYERNLKASFRQRNGQPWKSSDLPPAPVLWSGSQRHQRPQRPQRRQPPCHGPKGKRLIRPAETQHSCLSEEVTVQMQVGFYQIPITLLDIICVDVCLKFV